MSTMKYEGAIASFKASYTNFKLLKWKWQDVAVFTKVRVEFYSFQFISVYFPLKS